ncbi:hypothetical protein SAMN05192550_0144 [Flavobacterium glycines]|uniref:Cyanobacterial TRADD-N associated 2 transmembrane domain-containing protein n=1 Tax=Flavobacterium glycines TaxID=551990 RepID=A0A1B9DMT7_9FLAO|nr:hypothetical protein [Flavobacterium glycines]OCB70994.1 hypothetical protein FBGL_11105 [Flavobacterium glycines]GEL10804.1 hypothetical protein FGL01_15430 [Flavobacterium glycines]SDI53642.1 hypothetical protein SAMN05192550_0144 [Flavobacterium glycines]
MTDIFEIANSIVRETIIGLRKNKKVRKIFIIVFSTILLCSIGILIFLSEDLDSNFLEFITFLTVFSSIMFLITLISYTDIKIDNKGLTVELNKIKRDREKIIEQITQQENNVFNTIQLSLNQITEYYTINLNQARSSYRWSITAIIIGLITLISGAWLLFFQTTPNITVGIITGISGIIIEFIGASNIYIYNKSLVQLNLYFKELLNIQDTMLAIELCEKIEDSNPKKLEITERIIISLMTRSSTKNTEN